MTETEQRGPVPPYVSFGTLLNQLERMSREGVPARVDGSYLVGMAGGTQNQFKQALRSLGLIGDNDQASGLLVRLAKEPDERPAIVAELLRDRYPSLVELDENATRGQLDEALAAFGLGSETRRKAAGFYVAAATYAGLPLSPHLRATRGPVSGGTPRRRPRATRRPSPESLPTTPSTTATTAVGSPDDMRRAYFELLLDKAKASDNTDTTLLDRIERLIQLPEPAPTPATEPRSTEGDAS